MNQGEQLRQGRVAIDMFLGLFGGNDEKTRCDVVMGGGNIAVLMGISSVKAEAIHRQMVFLQQLPQLLEREGDLEGAAAVRAITVLALGGAFCARTTVEMSLTKNLADTVNPQ